MESAVKVSILIPSLNVGKYIIECMESVINQTLKEIEIICIDAGSTDGTLEILREYEAQDHRIRVVVSDRKSYGYQMNLGLNAARGEYIGIVESDDWAEPDMFESLWRVAKEHNADHVKTNHYIYYTETEIKDEPFENLKGCHYEKVFAPREDPRLFFAAPTIWTAIYSRQMLLENGIRFVETPGASYQDTAFVLKVYTVSERTFLLDRFFLHYRKDNENSSVNSKGKVFCVCDEMHSYDAFLSSCRLTETEKERLGAVFMRRMLLTYTWNYSRIAAEDQWSFLRMMYEDLSHMKARGFLERSLYTENEWRDISEILTAPEHFFQRTCKKYATHPSGDQLLPGEVLKENRQLQPDISIIVPAYNVDEHLAATLESVTEQTWENIEIICVDDGSEDDTLAIALAFAERDSRLTVVHQMNQGVATVRNAGLKLARGEYILFVDGDDILQKDACRYLLTVARERQLDILFFDGKSIYETPELEKKFRYLQQSYEYNTTLPEIMTGREYFCIAKEDRKYRATVTMALILRRLVQDCQAGFTDGILHEDHDFSFCCIMNAQRVSHTTKKFYFRTVHDNSIVTGSVNERHVYGYLRDIQGHLKVAEQLPYDEKLNEQVASEITHLCSLLKNAYAKLPNKQDFRQRLIPMELLLLDKQLQPDQYKKKYEDIKRSTSWRIGRMFTWPLRKLKSFWRYLKKHGIRKTLQKITGIEATKKNREPHVLFVSSDANKMSGAFLSEVELNRLLNNKNGIETHIILPYKSDGEKIVKDAGVHSHVIPSSDWIVPVGTKRDLEFREEKYQQHTRNLRAAIAIARYALKNQYNIIHSNTTYTYVGQLAAQMAGLPHVWHFREFLEEDQNREIYCKKKGYRLISRATRVVTISQALHDKYAELVSKSRLRVIYNGLSPADYYHPKKQIFKNEIPIFLFVSGSDSPHKGRKDLIQACSLLAAEGLEFQLWFVGWYDLELQKMAEEAGLVGRIKWIGYQKDTSKYYQKADIFFMCSRFEAFGQTTVEAMMNGCLVIGTNAGGTSEVIRDGETGFLYPYGQPEKLADCIRIALNNRETMRLIAAAGRRDMIKRMTAEKNARQIAQLYNEVLAECPPLSRVGRKIAKGRTVLAFLRYQVRKQIVGPIYHRLATLHKQRMQQEVERTTTTTLSGGPKISVIVPVYNVREYLRQCLDSICGQTLHELEIICVNDGSTDGSDDIVREYMQKDDRIVLIDKENSGYGASMNCGMAQATGTYIAIVETDDFIDLDMYRKLFAIAEVHGGVDIVKSAFWLYYDTEDGQGEIKEAPIVAKCHPPKQVFTIREYPEILFHHPSIWSCLYRREFLEKNEIRFVEAEGAGWVDNPFFLETFYYAERICWTPEAYYYYRQTNPNASSFLKDCTIPFARTKEMLAFLDEKGIEDSFIRWSVYKRILWNTAAALNNPNYIPEKDDRIIVDQLRRVSPDFLLSNRVTDSERDAYEVFLGKRHEE